MQTITNSRDFRLWYEVVNMMQETIVRDASADESIRKQREAHVAGIKRSLRQYANRDTSFDRRIIKDEGMDGFIALERLPDDIKGLDEAKEFFERFMSFPRTNSMYDCTGRPVTSWFKVFQRRGRYYAYHSVSFDV